MVALVCIHGEGGRPHNSGRGGLTRMLREGYTSGLSIQFGSDHRRVARLVREHDDTLMLIP